MLKDKTRMVPNEVVRAIVKMDKTPLQAWREYLQLSKNVVSGRLGVSEMQLEEMENQPCLDKYRLQGIAVALGLNVEQIDI